MAVYSVKIFSVLRERTGQNSLRIDVPAPATPTELADALSKAYPDVAPYLPYARIAVNCSYVEDMEAVYPEDEVAILMPASGG